MPTGAFLYRDGPEGMVPVHCVGEGEPLVVVPGLAGGVRLLWPLIRELAPHMRVHVCELPGERDPLRLSRTECLAQEARDVAATIRTLGLERPTVLGVSYGSALALEVAVQQPDLVGALALSGACSHYEPGLGGHVARHVLERYALPTDSPFVNQFFNLLHGGRPSSAELAAQVAAACWGTDQTVMAARLRGLEESFDVRERLWRIDVPTLVLAGSRDVVVPPREQAQLAASISSARLLRLDGAGHIGFVTHPQPFARAICRLVRDRQRAML